MKLVKLILLEVGLEFRVEHLLNWVESIELIIQILYSTVQG